MSSGLYYLRGRYYSPTIGRFISEDPARADSPNWYIYCLNNPIRYTDPTGYAVTDEDRKHLNSNQIKQMERYTTDYETAQVNNDYFGMNQARANAVKLRQDNYYYEDTFDYTHGQGILTFIGVHSVAAGQYHTSVVIFASSDLGDDFNSVYGGRATYATIGAGPIGGRLRSDTNREKDVMLDIKKEMINLNLSDVTTINNLFTLEGNFHDDSSLDYEWFPNGLSNGYNSNSFTRGLLNAAGITIPRSPSKSVPGWNKPLPNSYFE